VDLPDGPYFEVKTHFSMINYTAVCSKPYVANLLLRWVSELYKIVQSGSPIKDTPFEKIKVSFHPGQKEKSADEELKTVLFYATRARMIFEHALPQKLADFTEQLLMEVFISTVYEMEAGKVIDIEGGRFDVWDIYLDDLKRMLKRNWNLSIPKGTKYWNRQKRAELLGVYDWALLRLQYWQDRFHGNKKEGRRRLTGEEWKAAEQSWMILVPYLKLLPNSTPHNIALEFAMKFLHIRGEHQVRKQLTLAREERSAVTQK
jgi:hypothetical protein